MKTTSLSTLFLFTDRRRPKGLGTVPAVRKVSPALLLLALCTFSCYVGQGAERDPFWPIGYKPPEAEPSVVAKPAAPAPTPQPSPKNKPPPPPKPISQEDWVAAKKSLSVSGFAQAVHPGTGEKRTVVMINRHSYSTGDSICITNAGIRFLWNVESITGPAFQLTPVKAERLLPAREPSLPKPTAPSPEKAPSGPLM